MDFSLNGTVEQNLCVEWALARCTFPFNEIAQDKLIPVDWADLSSYGAVVSEAAASGGHAHVHEGDDIGHPIEARERVLGLAWYSGRVTLDLSLVRNPQLAAEVFLAEGAHMLDFFWFTDRERMVVWNALHPDQEDLPLDTNVEDGQVIGGTEGWFDVGPYRSWVGEAWMGLFVKAYSDVSVTIPFDRPPTDEAVAYLHANLFTPVAPPEPPVEEPAPEPPGEEPVPEFPPAPSFAIELESLLNKHSMENASGTPDFILAQFLLSCLDAYNTATQNAQTWKSE